MSKNFTITGNEEGVMIAKFEACCPKIDARNYEEIQNEIIEILKNRDINNFVFDLDNVSYVSSAGLRMFSAVNKVASENCIDYKLINLVSEIYRMFELTGYASAFKIEEKVQI